MKSKARLKIINVSAEALPRTKLNFGNEPEIHLSMSIDQLYFSSISTMF